MAVGVQSKAGTGMPQPGADHLGVYAGLEQQAAGCGDEVRAILGDLDKLALSWHDGEYGVMSLVDV